MDPLCCSTSRRGLGRRAALLLRFLLLVEVGVTFGSIPTCTGFHSPHPHSLSQQQQARTEKVVREASSHPRPTESGVQERHSSKQTTTLSLPNAFLHQFLSKTFVPAVITASTIVAVATAAVLSGPVFAAAATATPVPPIRVAASVFTNNYGDPFHPHCQRRIQVSPDGRTFSYSGTAVGPRDDPVRRGCTPSEIATYKLRHGAFEGVIFMRNTNNNNDNGGQTVVISAGDGIHEGVWEPAGTATTKLGYETVNGIRWNDGNKWFVLEDSEQDTK